MSRAVFTANRFHLGDNLIFLHLLRALAKSHVSRAFVHFCNGSDIPQLREAAQDIPNILLEPFESPLWKAHEHEAVDTWKNAESHWERSPNRWDWPEHTLEHHAWTARRMGLESPFTCREQLLFEVQGPVDPSEYVANDFLIVNSEPCSGQFGPMRQHGSGYMNELILALSQRNRVIVTEDFEGRPKYIPTTRRANFSVSQIGANSTNYRHHIMVASGPMWLTLNTTNHHHSEGRKRIVLLDNGEQLNMPHITQCARVEEVMEIAKEENWI